jgi:hypothetical protein
VEEVCIEDDYNSGDEKEKENSDSDLDWEMTNMMISKD